MSARLQSILRRHLFEALAELEREGVEVPAGGQSVVVQDGSKSATIAVTIQGATGPAVIEPVLPIENLPQWEERKRPSLRERIQAILTDQPVKQVTLARRTGHPCDSYFREQCSQLQAEGKMVRDPGGGFRRPQPGEQPAA